ncbi:MAG: hypothetical protein IPP22_09290 [Nitrosomonas sp.]|nr:hypothetical protein [Nitrosomonas sp.]
MGCNFPKDFKEQGGTTLLNRQIKSAHELAVMARFFAIRALKHCAYFIHAETALSIILPSVPGYRDRCIWKRSMAPIIIWVIG